MYIPQTVHPNMLTFCSFLCVLVAYRLSQSMGFDSLEDPAIDNTQPKQFWTILFIQALIGIYMHLDALDGKQARRLRCSSPIGELLDHALDNIGMIFSLLAALNIWGVTCISATYTLTFVSSALFLTCHLDAYTHPKQTIYFGLLTGPCESILIYQLICIGGIWRKNVYVNHQDWCEMIAYIPYVLLSIVVIYFIEKIYTFWNDKHRLPWITGAVLVYLLRAGNGWVNFIDAGNGGVLEAKTYIMEGMLLSCVTTECIFSKMAKAPFAPVLLMLALIGWLGDWAGIVFSVTYYVQLFANLSHTLDLPLFRLKKRVYCCGVFDMCHRGHMNLFKRTLKYGDNVIVGVHNDEDVMSYKHAPVVSHEERVRTVELCKNVHEVIPNAPLVLDDKFLDEYRIEAVVCSDEYDKPDDHYYRAARDRGILHVLGRTTGISSSEIREIAASPRITSSQNLQELAARAEKEEENRAPKIEQAPKKSVRSRSRARKQ